MDYYDVLGISRGASEQEIRKAYKTKSMKHHPDRGGDEEEFKKVNEAYSTLKDPQKRAQYDNYGAGNFGGDGFDFRQADGFGSQYGYGFDDVMSEMFGQHSAFSDIFGRRSQRTQQRNKSLNLNYKISLSEAYTGKELYLQVPLPSGRKQTIETTIPRGIENGQTIRLSGLGDDSIKQLPPGDILLTINVDKDATFDRDGCDLYQTIHVSIYDLILGSKVQVKHISGKSFELNIPAGTQPGTTFSMREQGMPILNAPGIGTMFVTIKGVVPKDINEYHKELIERARVLTNTRKDV
jgi:curved DNA-binding protein